MWYFPRLSLALEVACPWKFPKFIFDVISGGMAFDFVVVVAVVVVVDGIDVSGSAVLFTGPSDRLVQAEL